MYMRKAIVIGLGLSLLVLIRLAINARNRKPDSLAQRHVKHIHIPLTLEDLRDHLLDDDQNVHNTTIETSCHRAISQLHARHEKPVSLQELETLLYEHHLAYKVYREIVKINDPAEIEVLQLVWNRINSPVNQSCKTELINNLIQQFEDCLDDESNLVCLQGRIARLIQTLQCSDMENIVDMRPMWAYREEISNIFAKYQNHPVEEAISIIKNQLNRDYIESGILTVIQLEDLTKPYYQVLVDSSL